MVLNLVPQHHWFLPSLKLRHFNFSLWICRLWFWSLIQIILNVSSRKILMGISCWGCLILNSGLNPFLNASLFETRDETLISHMIFAYGGMFDLRTCVRLIIILKVKWEIDLGSVRAKRNACVWLRITFSLLFLSVNQVASEASNWFFHEKKPIIYF